jgi:hypothetical protein
MLYPSPAFQGGGEAGVKVGLTSNEKNESLVKTTDAHGSTNNEDTYAARNNAASGSTTTVRTRV